MVSKNLSVSFKKKINKFNKSIEVDSDKSISQRCFIIGSICEGISIVDNILESRGYIINYKMFEKTQL